MKSEIKVKNYYCSDINADLIALWKIIKTEPLLLQSEYENRWKELNKDENKERKKEYFLMIRDRFNHKKNPFDFFFLNRTSFNGLIRYNQKGEFNSSLHHGRKGIHPERLIKIVTEWSYLLNKHRVTFEQKDYKSCNPSKEDVVYIDPPYFLTKGMYYGTIDYEEFWDWLHSVESMYLLSFDGMDKAKEKVNLVPSSLYAQHMYIESGNSSFIRLKQKEQQIVKESLYIQHNRERRKKNEDFLVK